MALREFVLSCAHGAILVLMRGTVRFSPGIEDGLLISAGISLCRVIYSTTSAHVATIGRVVWLPQFEMTPLRVFLTCASCTRVTL
jgi:hypothetical protein